MWQINECSDGRNHIVPVNDLMPHKPLGCECNPYVNEDGVVVHRAWDKREQFEEGPINKTQIREIAIPKLTDREKKRERYADIAIALALKSHKGKPKKLWTSF